MLTVVRNWPTKIVAGSNHCKSFMLDQNINSNKGLKVVHVNIRSLYRKVDQLSCLFQNVDFLLCTETWLNHNYEDSLIKIPGMTTYRMDRCDVSLAERDGIPKRGGGVIIYANHKWVPYITKIDIGCVITKNLESVTISVEKPNNRKMTIMCLYKPPTGCIDKVIEFLKNVLLIPSISHSEIWILGDFNINIAIRNSPPVMSINRFLKEHGLKQLITESTRATARGGSCIDWIITNSLFVYDSGVLNMLLSDHFPVYVIRKKARETVKKVKKRVRILKNYNEDNFKALFDNIDWASYFDCENPDSLWDVIHKRIVDILEIMCPYKNILVREEKTPWFTNEIYACIKKRSEYVKFFRSTGSNDAFIISKFFRNKCNSLIRQAKSNFIRENLTVNRDNPKKFWRVLNGVLKHNISSKIDFEFIDPSSRNCIPTTETSDFLNNFYAKVGKRKYPQTDSYQDRIVNRGPFEIGDINLAEVRTLILQIDISKDSCIEGVPAKILKAAMLVCPDAILHLFVKSLMYGIFPRKWAIGYINILPKGGDKRNPSNWRPITQTCIPAKLLEKIVTKRLLCYFEDNNILDKNQFGFRKGYSTQKAIFELLCDMHYSVNSDEIMGLLFLDISKAFDSLDHAVLLRKLKHISLSENSLDWFRSYLDRFQMVRVNGELSSAVKFEYGIPQGSCLGPTLFIFYINEIFRFVENVKIMMFADDCVLYKSSISWDDIHQPLQESLDVYIKWGRDHNLDLNASKTKAMITCSPTIRSRMADPAPFNAGNSRISFVDHFCYLGCIIDNGLTMLPQYKAVYRRVEQKIFMLAKLRYLLDKNSTVLIYKQTILPYIDYVSFVLLSCNNGMRKNLQTLQNNALRLSLRYKLADHVSIEQLHREAKLQSVEQRCLFHLLKILYSYSKSVDHVKPARRLTRAGNKIVFKLPTRCSERYLNSPLYVGAKIWDNLHEDTQRLASIDQFVRRVKPNYVNYRECFNN